MNAVSLRTIDKAKESAGQPKNTAEMENILDQGSKPTFVTKLLRQMANAWKADNG